MRRFIGVALPLLVPLVLCGGCLWGVWPYRNLGTCDLGGGYALQVWVWEHPFDLDSRGPSIYYRVTRGSRVVVAKTWLGRYRGEPMRLRTAFADHGRQACVYNDKAFLEYTFDFFLFDLVTEECWPRHAHYDEAGGPIPRE